MKKLLLATMMLFATPAMPATMQGSVSFFPNQASDDATQTITQLTGFSGAPFVTGDFALYDWQTMVPANVNQTVSYSSLGTNGNLFCGANCLFVATDNVGHFAWFVENPVVTIVIPGLDNRGWLAQGTGTMFMTGFDPTSSTFSWTGQPRGVPFQEGFTFSAPVTPVPLPAAIWLFGAALVGVAALAKKKRGAPAPI